ncbi:ATP-dependent nuclease [Alistipes sp. ZOR0009]|uniref:ATP-dependent nuclease n=1 Tax=Alistipes sp. ZOR0009 TaxID=1339253 RepID=UPI0006893C58|nr:AAA family ATPase [Alistipes sp. ZOR0009]
MTIDKLTIRNYKCFDETGTSIEALKSINVIIGKNNSGKSSVIDVFKFLTTNDSTFFKNRRNGKAPEIEFEHIVNDRLIKQSFDSSVSGGDIGMNHQQFGLSLVNSTLTYTINENGKNSFKGLNKNIPNGARQYFERYLSLIHFPLNGKIFSHLSAERDIQPESPRADLALNTNGVGATNLIQTIINRDNYDSNLIEKTLLNELNKIINPDIDFTRILVQQNENGNWEIYFESADDGRVPLSKMGSGVKTVLLVLILLYVKPKIDSKNVGDYVFALEELENNLHPSLQRRLYYFIYQFAKSNNCVFLLTTHSNIVIDLYNSLDETQILHISKLENRTTIKSTLKETELRTILDDLDVRASDILQSNGIIWVEGPSDRTYINNWIKLLDNSLVEGYHYSIMFYGGRLLSNLSFDYDLINKELIPLLKLNNNSFVVIDRDGKTINAKLNDTKTRIQNEIGENKAWITKGREIENYLSNDALQKWLKEDYNIDCTFDNELNTKLEDNIFKIGKAIEKIQYNLNKNKYANEIVKYIDKTNFEILDLKQNLDNLISTIKRWNKI